MKKYTVLSVLVFACFSIQAAELNGTRFAGYTTNALSAGGFSIVAVPFSGFDTNSFAITNLSLEALVLTNGLSIDDRLIAFEEATTNYYYYSLKPEGWLPLAVNQIGTDSTNHVVIRTGDPLLTVTKAQGYAFWLKTQTAATVYLQGIVNTNVAGVAIVTNAFTLIGNALPTPLDLNSLTNANTWFTPYNIGTATGDAIHAVVNGSNYQKNVFYGGKWQAISNNSFVASSTIPAGAGIWYYRHGTNVTFKLQ